MTLWQPWSNTRTSSEPWWNELSEDEQETVDVSVRLLEAKGIALPFPHSSDVKGSKHGNMRELRT